MARAYVQATAIWDSIYRRLEQACCIRCDGQCGYLPAIDGFGDDGPVLLVDIDVIGICGLCFGFGFGLWFWFQLDLGLQLQLDVNRRHIDRQLKFCEIQFRKLDLIRDVDRMELRHHNIGHLQVREFEGGGICPYRAADEQS
ncbi:MAG: hypothetical protein WC261_14940 [Synergistaceae bacterium]